MGKLIELPNYDNWKLSSGQDDEIIVYNCEHCGGEIYQDNEIYKTNEGIVHEECFVDFAIECLEAYQTNADKDGI